MDIFCPKCAEPVELDYLHTVADDNDTTFDVELGRFQTLGCEAIGASHNPNRDTGRASAAAAMYDLLGDDIDGAAAMLEDFEALGYFN